MPNMIAKSTGLQRFTGAPVTGGESYNAKHDGQKHWVTEVYRCSGFRWRVIMRMANEKYLTSLLTKVN